MSCAQPRTVYPFDPLADVLSRFPVLTEHARFVLVPGPSDPASLTASFALPRDPLPAIMLPPTLGGGSASTRRSDAQQNEEDEEEEDDVESDDGGDDDDGDSDDGGGKRTKTKSVSGTAVVAEVIRGSNPCRVKYAGQDLLFYRGDMQDKFLRYALDVPRADDADEGREDAPRFEQAARTIADAGHLSPFPQAAQPVYWDHVQGLYMDPLPDLLVLGTPGADVVVSFLMGIRCGSPLLVAHQLG
jgi:DNA polymerase epsilon subunit 2